MAGQGFWAARSFSRLHERACRLLEQTNVLRQNVLMSCCLCCVLVASHANLNIHLRSNTLAGNLEDDQCVKFTM